MNWYIFLIVFIPIQIIIFACLMYVWTKETRVMRKYYVDELARFQKMCDEALEKYEKPLT